MAQELVLEQGLLLLLQGQGQVQELGPEPERVLVQVPAR